MNSLQIWLAIIGGLVLAGVIGHGAWQTRRAAGRARPTSAPAGTASDTTPLPPPDASDPGPGTVPMALEPSFGPEPTSTRPAVFDALPREPAVVREMEAIAPAPAVVPVAPIEQRLSEVPAALAHAPRRHSSPARIDALIDAIVPIGLDAPLSAEQVLAQVPPTRRAGSKPFLIEGRHAETGQWEPLAASARYSALQAGVQQVNRGGAINEIE